MNDPQEVYVRMYFSIMGKVIEEYLCQKEVIGIDHVLGSWRVCRKICKLYNTIEGNEDIDTLYISGMHPVKLIGFTRFREEFIYIYNSRSRNQIERERWERIPNNSTQILAGLNTYDFVKRCEVYLKEFPKYSKYLLPVIAYQEDRNREYARL